MADVVPCTAPAVLRDGTRAELHVMCGDDADALLRFHHRLSDRTTRYRFFTIHRELSSDELDRFTHVDHRDREAIVATIDGEIVAVARFDRLDDGCSAEPAFVVADEWQGHGLGGVLLCRLVTRARELGITRFVAEVLPDNTRMLKVFRGSGLPCTVGFSQGVAEVVLEVSSTT